MNTSFNFQNTELHQRMIAAGFYEKYKVSTVYRCEICQEVGYAKQRATAERVLLVTLGLIGFMGCCCFLCSWPLEACNAGLDEEILEKRYYPNPDGEKEATEKDKQLLGFDPKSRQSIIDYLSHENPKLIECAGHYFKAVITTGGKSAIIFVPNSDVKNVEFQYFWDNKTGESLNESDLYKAGIKYALAYRQVRKAKKIEAQKLAADGTFSAKRYEAYMKSISFRGDGSICVRVPDRSDDIDALNNDPPNGRELPVSKETEHLLAQIRV